VRNGGRRQGKRELTKIVFPLAFFLRSHSFPTKTSTTLFSQPRPIVRKPYLIRFTLPSSQHLVRIRPSLGYPLSPPSPSLANQLSQNSTFHRMITSSDQRLGRNSADEIKAHPFFAGVDWNTIRNIESPFIPQLR